MIRKSLTAFLFMLLAAQYFQPHAQTVQPISDSAKLVRLLEETGFPYKKVQDGIWAIPFEGKTAPDFHMLITGQKDLIVVFVILAEKKSLKVTPDMTQAMLKLNDYLDRVKVFIDDDGDAMVRADLSLRILDKQELKLNIDQVAHAVEEAHKALRQFITVAK